jgi:hypothetical protein
MRAQLTTRRKADSSKSVRQGSAPASAGLGNGATSGVPLFLSRGASGLREPESGEDSEVEASELEGAAELQVQDEHGVQGSSARTTSGGEGGELALQEDDVAAPAEAEAKPAEVAPVQARCDSCEEEKQTPSGGVSPADSDDEDDPDPVQLQCDSCEPEAVSAPPVTIQAQCDDCAREETQASPALQRRDEGQVQKAQEAVASRGVQHEAQRGVTNASEPLPHYATIQAAFGAHDVSGVRAEVGGAGGHAATAIGAQAYAVGDRIAFKAEPDLHLAAHEAAHTVQQRGGVQLRGGVGRPGDAYERHADEVADAVVRGESAQPILDRKPAATDARAGAGEAAPVQHRLEANAVHLQEPPAPMLPREPPARAPSRPAGAREGGGEGATPAVTSSAIAAAQAGAPAELAPAVPAGPAGGVEAAAEGGTLNAHCYRAAIEEPADDSGDEPTDPPVAEPQEEVHADLPTVDERDDCPVESAIGQTTASLGGPMASLGGPMASSGPSGPGGTASTADAAPASAESTAAPDASAPAAAAGGETSTGPASTDTAAGEGAPDAPSPLQDATLQAEAGRADAMARFEASSAVIDSVGASLAALPTDISFAEPPGAGARERERQVLAGGRVSEFLQHAATRLRESISFASEDVPDRFGSLAESIKASIGAQLEQQKSSVSQSVEAARGAAYAVADAARASVHGAHDAYVAAVAEQTASAIDTLQTAHDSNLEQVDQLENDSLSDINALYGTGHDDIVALGPTYAGQADARAELYVAEYEKCKIWEADGSPRKDGFFAGYLTNRRAEAQQKAALDTAHGYHDSLIEAANNQAAQATQGRKHDRCGVIASARATRRAMADRLTALVDTLTTGSVQATTQAGALRDSLLAGLETSLLATVGALGREEHDSRQTLDDTGYLQQVAVEQAAFSAATAVQDAVVSAVDRAQQALNGTRATLAGTPAPSAEDLDGVVAGATRSLDAQLDLLMAGVNAAVDGGESSLIQAEQAGLAALDADGQGATARVSAASASFAQQMASVASSATSNFAALTEQYTSQTEETASAGAEGFAQAVIGFESVCETMLTNIETNLTQAATRLEQNFQGRIAGLDDEASGIPKQAQDAAAREQPAWKSVVAVILVIAIIIVVALVIGPAVIGAVGAAAAALGASAGVATAVGAIVGGAIVGALSSGAMTLIQNWASGQRWDTGLWRAMAVGALTGAIGGAVGLGVNSGLNALIGQGSRFALSQGAQFVVRAAVNITSDALMNIGQQLAIAGHVDWGEFAQGMVVSLVLHGSRRIQAFQARVTARSAGAVSGAIGRVSGTGSVASARASAYAGDLRTQAQQATAEAKGPLDWTAPPAGSAAGAEAPTTPTEAESTPARPAETEASAPAAEAEVGTGRATEAEPTAPRPSESEAAAPTTEDSGVPRPTEAEGATPRDAESRAAEADGAPPREVDTEPTAGGTREPETSQASELEPIASAREVEQVSTKIGDAEHTLTLRETPDGLELWMCTVCGPIKAKIDAMLETLPPGSPLREQLARIRSDADGVEANVRPAEARAALRDLAARLRAVGDAHPELGSILDASPDMTRLGTRQEEPITLEGEALANPDLRSRPGWEDRDLLYTVYERMPDGTRRVLKVGEESTRLNPRGDPFYESRFSRYRSAARRSGIEIEIEVAPVEVPAGRTLEGVEQTLRDQVDFGEEGSLPWDATRVAGFGGQSRLGPEHAGPGVPFEPLPGGSPLRDTHILNPEGRYVPKDSGAEPYVPPPRSGAPSPAELRASLTATRGNVTAAARAAGVPRETFRDWLAAAGIDPTSFRNPQTPTGSE